MQYWAPVAVLLISVLVAVIAQRSDKSGSPVVEWMALPLIAAAFAGWGAWCGLSAHRRALRISVLIGCGLAFVGTFAVSEGTLHLPKSWADLRDYFFGYLLFGGLESLLVFAVCESLFLQVERASVISAIPTDQSSADIRFQISIRGAMLATAAMALLLAGYLSVDEPDAFLNLGPGIYLANGLAAALALPAIWLVFGNRKLRWRIAGGMAVVAAVCAVIWSVGHDSPALFALPPGVIFCCSLLLWPFRVAGYRLTRRRTGLGPY